MSTGSRWDSARSPVPTGSLLSHCTFTGRFDRATIVGPGQVGLAPASAYPQSVVVGYPDSTAWRTCLASMRIDPPRVRSTRGGRRSWRLNFGT
jgi:hypothetical protein